LIEEAENERIKTKSRFFPFSMQMGHPFERSVVSGIRPDCTNTDGLVEL